MNKTVSIPGSSLITLPPTKIEVGERFRKDYGDLTELAKSIEQHGLINPVTVVGSEEKGYTLVAGGRRLEAMKSLNWTDIPVRVFSEQLSNLDLRILELAENLQRKEMTWNESNALQLEIHRLQTEKYGKAAAGGTATQASEGPEVRGWRMQDTADMLGISRSQVGQSLQLAEKFERYAPVLGDPGNYKTENDARKAIKIVEESMARAELAKRAASQTTSLTKTVAANYIVGDCFEGLAGIKDEAINFVECDPPYAIDLQDKKRHTDCSEYNEEEASTYVAFTDRVLNEIWRVLAPDSFALYWYALEPWAEVVYQRAARVGFKLTRIPLLWVKPNAQSLSPNTQLANAFETALILHKGNPVLAKPGRINVFSYPPMPPNKKHHPTQKPLELYTEIFSTFSFENAKCLSVFAGSGAAILAAYLTGRQCMGWDLSREYKNGFIKMVSDTFLETIEGGK